MTDKFVMHGVNLTDMGIGDVESVVNHHEAMVAMSEHFVRQILGSITFGPFIPYPDSGLPEHDDGLPDEDDGDWEYAE